LFLDYTYGIGKIYSKEEIEKAKASRSFEREYNLKYLGKIGNVFHTKDIEAAIEIQADITYIDGANPSFIKSLKLQLVTISVFGFFPLF
jgi:hypothetical protein